MQTNDFTFIGDYVVHVKAYLTKYPNIESNLIEMTLHFERCTVSKYITPDIETVEIEPYGEEVTMDFDGFVAVGAELCGYEWSYEAFYNE